ncbi:MAG: J domain-containing protein [Bryobacteraceae bacterium]
MSAPLAGKFQDHYAVLGIEPKSEPETIQRAYADLAQKYSPNNSSTGDPEMFEAVNMAYETLSNPELRAIFDKLKGVGQEKSVPKFSGVEFFDALGREGVRRTAILCVLYDRRLIHPSAPGLSMRHLELIVEATASELSSAIWYLKQRGLVASDDKSSMHITVDGMDFLEKNQPTAEDVMPFIKVTGTSAAQAKPARGAESVLTTLNRALGRNSTQAQGEVVR